MPHPKPAEGNVALISPPEGAVAAAAPAPEADDRWVWFEDEHGERFRVPRSWVQGAPADASNAGGSAEEADPDEAGGIHIKNPTLSRMFSPPVRPRSFRSFRRFLTTTMRGSSYFAAMRARARPS